MKQTTHPRSARHWGPNKHDTKFRSPKQILQNPADIASKGGNYLLNVGPTAEGVIPQNSVDLLKTVGEWTAKNGDAIYGTTASPLAETPNWGRVTQKGNTLYLHVFDWPTDGKPVVPGAKVDANSAYLLTDAAKAPLQVNTTGDALTVSLPASASAPDPVDSVGVLQAE
jgi:alpha-L-fucosidase